ncbi:hypothetical protein [Lactobacillus intestinalis]|uniref:hypothetical protein n=1 Tax=Lactobacillus intestinalis TaxID=151781 RepID=UPI0025A937BB|nr:hypothetical protein [Lactobacillus intestinalis]
MLDEDSKRSIVGGGIPFWYYSTLRKIGVSGYKHRKDILSGFDKGFKNFQDNLGVTIMEKKKGLKAKFALVGIIVLGIIVSFSLWTHRADFFQGFDAGFEQTK